MKSYTLPKAPKLQEFSTRELSKDELQAALLYLIKQYNGLLIMLNDMQNRGQIMSEHDALINTKFGL